MNPADLEKLKYPVGKFIAPEEYSNSLRQEWIEIIAKFPERIAKLTESLSIDQLNWRYRPDGWKIKQVVHHCADSHMNAFIRFKLALSENSPTIKPYLQSEWAKMADVDKADIEDSLMILRGLHKRFFLLLDSMSDEDFKRTYIHPEYGQTYPLGQVAGMYAWHCSHHLGHIRQAIHHKGQF